MLVRIILQDLQP